MMNKIRRPWKLSRRDTDSVALEGVGSQTENGKHDITANATGIDNGSDSNSHDAKAVEADLRRFSVLHAFDPNMPGTWVLYLRALVSGQSI